MSGKVWFWVGLGLVRLSKNRLGYDRIPVPKIIDLSPYVCMPISPIR